MLSTSVIRAAPTFILSIPVTGTPPIYTALIRDITVLFNTTYTASIYLEKEENYTCVASSEYGIDVRDFSVIFTGKTFYHKIPNPLSFCCDFHRFGNLNVCSTYLLFVSQDIQLEFPFIICINFIV